MDPEKPLQTTGAKRLTPSPVTSHGVLLSREPHLNLPRRNDVLPEKQRATYQAFYDSARNNDILPEKTTLMLHLAAAMGLGCDP